MTTIPATIMTAGSQLLLLNNQLPLFSNSCTKAIVQFFNNGAKV
jgi:hypothetical protein